jgi:hypothetical protein
MRVITSTPFIAIGIIAIVAIAFLLIFFLFVFGTAHSSPISATLTVISDDVFVQRAGSDSWEKVEVQTRISEGDCINTSSDGCADIVFSEGNYTQIEPETEICLEKLFSDRNGSVSVKFTQGLGRTVNRVEKLIDPASRFEVETSAAAAVVRGTVFNTEVDQNGKTTVSVLDGVVYVIGQGQEVQVDAGWQTVINPGEPPSPPTRIPSNLDEAIAELNGVREAINTCIANAGQGKLDGDFIGWNGSYGIVTAGDGKYDAADYLDITLRAKYSGNKYGDITCAMISSWWGISWHSGIRQWVVAE